MNLSNEWKFDDKNIHLVFNFTDIRAAVGMNVNEIGGEKVLNDTIKGKTNE